jgi:hypothetical protein
MMTLMSPLPFTTRTTRRINVFGHQYAPADGKLRWVQALRQTSPGIETTCLHPLQRDTLLLLAGRAILGRLLFARLLPVESAWLLKSTCTPVDDALSSRW